MGEDDVTIAADERPHLGRDAGDEAARVAMFLDEWEIKRVIDAFDNALDAEDWVRCRATLADTVTYDVSDIHAQQPGDELDADAMLAQWRTRRTPGKQYFHMRTNHEVAVRGQEAIVHSKRYSIVTQHRRTGSDVLESWVEYRHGMTLGPRGWVISSIRARFVYGRGNEQARDAADPGSA